MIHRPPSPSCAHVFVRQARKPLSGILFQLPYTTSTLLWSLINFWLLYQIFLGWPNSSNLFLGTSEMPCPPVFLSPHQLACLLSPMALPLLPHFLKLSPRSLDSSLWKIFSSPGALVARKCWWISNLSPTQNPSLNSRFMYSTAYSPSLGCPISISNLIRLKQNNWRSHPDLLASQFSLSQQMAPHFTQLLRPQIYKLPLIPVFPSYLTFIVQQVLLAPFSQYTLTLTTFHFLYKHHSNQNDNHLPSTTTTS